jgi:hypothetical protein
VAREGSWYDPGACWLNALYFRPVPSHAIEMTSAWLHQQVAGIVADRRVGRSTLAQRQRLAAVVHLCGRERGAAFAFRGFRALPGERCGAHDLAGYLGRVERFRRTFARLSATG